MIGKWIRQEKNLGERVRVNQGSIHWEHLATDKFHPRHVTLSWDFVSWGDRERLDKGQCLTLQVWGLGMGPIKPPCKNSSQLQNLLMWPYGPHCR